MINKGDALCRTERQLLRVKVANLFEEQPGHLTTVMVSVKIY